MADRQLVFADVIDRGVSLLPSSVTPAVGNFPPMAFDDLLPRMKDAARLVQPSDPFVDLARNLNRFKTPAQLAAAIINAKHSSLQGGSGFLGAATTGVLVCPDGVGYYRHFAGGSIYWHPVTGVHEVHGGIREKWGSLGWEKSFLGYPMTDETAGRDLASVGRFNDFQGGSIRWHPELGAHEVHGAIWAKYRELGAESSFLGYPLTDELGTPDNRGRYSHFQAGSIYWTSETSAHEVHGLIRDLWSSKGWERNPALGYPVSDELIPGGTGHLRPERRRKPIPEIPADVIRFPDAARPIGIPGTLSAAPLVLQPGEGGGIRNPVDVAWRPTDPNIFLDFIRDPILFPDLPSPSRNRFGDFENGVLFWKRGSTAAVQLNPVRRLPVDQVVTAASAILRKAIGTGSGGTLGMAVFAGTTDYTYDGATTHNRRHRMNVPLTGMYLHGPAASLGTAVVEVLVEVAYEPLRGKVVGFPAEWSLATPISSFLGGPPLDRFLHAGLDPILWKGFDLWDVPVTTSGAFLPVLSVKTINSGEVHLYLELPDFQEPTLSAPTIQL